MNSNPDVLHPSRRYMEIVSFKGRRIIGFRASCRAPRCGWTATYGNEGARVKGINEHRRTAMHQASSATHTYEDWSAIVDALIRQHYGVGVDGMEIDPVDLRRLYRRGTDAWGATAELTTETLEMV